MIVQLAAGATAGSVLFVCRLRLQVTCMSCMSAHPPIDDAPQPGKDWAAAAPLVLVLHVTTSCPGAAAVIRR
jgi:hypothetical protein